MLFLRLKTRGMNRKILHLSDLHCDGTSDWDLNFEFVIKLAEKVLPGIIVITGDLVDNPKDECFEKLEKSLDKMVSSIISKNDDKPLFLIPVPGNHDYYDNGIKLKNKPLAFIENIQSLIGETLLRKKGVDGKVYKKHFGKIAYPYNTDIGDLVKKAYEYYNVAIYPIDSNSLGWLADGDVESPEKQFEFFEDIFLNTSPNNNELNRLRVNIALLHHHPLPLPVPKKRKVLEPFLMLKNSYEFLYAAGINKIDLILHGHEHISGVSEFKTKERSDLVQLDSLNVVSCASSAKKEERFRQIRMLSLTDSGAVEGVSYRADIEKNFQKDKNFDIISYSERRRKRNVDVSYFKEINVVKSISTKTKLVILDKDGTSKIRISYSGIAWDEDVMEDEMHIKEYIRSDIGRVSHAWKRLYNADSPDFGSEFWVYDKNEKYKCSRLVDPENICLDVKPSKFDSIDRKKETHCEISYPFFNGFALSKEMHTEIYGKQVSSDTEFCTMESLYYTEIMELVVKFPEVCFMPEKVSVFAIKKTIGEDGLFLRIKEDDCVIDNEETLFLKRKQAVRYYPELSQISLVVKYPKPDLLYVLRWSLPRAHDYGYINDRDAEIIRKLKIAFSDVDDDRLTVFFNEINTVYKSAGVDVVVLGIDEGKNVFRVVKGGGPNIAGVEFRNGRGLAGKALRSREWQYFGKDALITSQVEKLSEDFEPSNALSIPLMYPYNEVISGNDEKYPVFAVISLLWDDQDTPLREFERGEKMDIEKVQEFQKCFNTGVYKALSSSFSELFT